MKTPLRYFFLLPLLALAGCLQDSASYAFPEKDHAITLVRNQTWFWQSTMDLEVIAIRLPQCSGGMTVKDAPLDGVFGFYRAPDEYPEPLHLLKVGKRVFAISTQSCRVQEFKDTPPDLGAKLGSFREKDGTFQFVAGGAGDKAEDN